MKTFVPKTEDQERKWLMIDATDLVLGRLATETARLLRGKHKAHFAPHVDCGDYVVIINADKIKTTGAKDSQKYYFRHTGYPGGKKITFLNEMRNNNSDEVIKHAIKGMLPHNKLSRQVIKKLFIYKEGEHPHNAQNPQPYQLP